MQNPNSARDTWSPKRSTGLPRVAVLRSPRHSSKSLNLHSKSPTIQFPRKSRLTQMSNPLHPLLTTAKMLHLEPPTSGHNSPLQSSTTPLQIADKIWTLRDRNGQNIQLIHAAHNLYNWSYYSSQPQLPDLPMHTQVSTERNVTDPNYCSWATNPAHHWTGKQSLLSGLLNKPTNPRNLDLPGSRAQTRSPMLPRLHPPHNLLHSCNHLA